MNPKNKHTIGLLVSDDLSINGKDVKESIKILIELFHKSLEINDFVNLVSDQEAEAITILEELK